MMSSFHLRIDTRTDICIMTVPDHKCNMRRRTNRKTGQKSCHICALYSAYHTNQFHKWWTKWQYLKYAFILRWTSIRYQKMVWWCTNDNSVLDRPCSKWNVSGSMLGTSKRDVIFHLSTNFTQQFITN